MLTTSSLYFVAITVALASMTTVDAEECGQEEFAKCAEPLEMLHLTSEFSIGAAKKEELDKLCHELRKGVRCIQSYTRRCMDMQQRHQFNKLYHGTHQFIGDLCNKGEFQDEYLRHAPCSEMAKREFEVCANRYKEAMVFLKPNKNQDTQENITVNENIKTICCSINQLVECSENAARKICGIDAAKFTRELVDKYASSLTKVLRDSRWGYPNVDNTVSKQNEIELKIKLKKIIKHGQVTVNTSNDISISKAYSNDARNEEKNDMKKMNN
ncbi:uncharacterized protein LOC119642463 isoform X1 [Glossina fuscipes]|uniref:Uncharacterized protein LOC119642463 isoform X1 n=1 Tax=Glossina fuscipes TaxID=7396 RepID=A0A9C6DP95_9MUSC|nr:uncharacterized protein LOC119642463 isoform X1 [Glossina fuscipes]XP_037897542.1 uncharacterized protein LOC119642463 isoform X1 [Glossina fuscipes]XP_037897543.1 uncharacterized protein LOC119642463 isoform X1 [Glossina fuscipes]